MLKKLRRSLRHNKYAWQYIFNLKPTLRFMFTGSRISPVQQRIANDLKKNGIAFSSVSELIEDKVLYEELLSSVNNLVDENKVDIETTRAKVDIDEVEVSDKNFLKLFLGKKPKFDANSVWNRFA